LFHTLPRPFELCFRRPKPLEDLADAGIVWESPRPPPLRLDAPSDDLPPTASPLKQDGSIGWEAWAASPRGVKSPLGPLSPGKALFFAGLEGKVEATFDPFASPFCGKASRSPRRLAAFEGVVEGATADVRLANSFGGGPSGAFFGEATGARPLTAKPSTRSPRSPAASFDPFASPKGQGPRVNPFDSCPAPPPVPPPAPPRYHPAASGWAAGAAFDFAETCTVSLFTRSLHAVSESIVDKWVHAAFALPPMLPSP